MVHDILFALWFLLPAAIANSAPIFAAHIPGLTRFDAPIDGGRTYRGVELLGTHKTWRGIIAGVIAATLVLGLQQHLVSRFDGLAGFAGAEVAYASLPLLLLGPLFGLGALGADAIESFFKRQRGIKSGRSWVPFDQIDYIVGGILVTLPFVVLRPVLYLWMLAVWFVLHLLASFVGYKLGIKERPI